MIEPGPRRRQRVAAAQARLKQLARPHPLVVRLPEPIAAIRLQPPHARLPAFPSFHHTLKRLQRMKIVAVHPPVAHAHRLPNPRAQRHVNRRRAPCHRQRRPGHKGKPHLLRNIIHLFRPVPPPRKMLVVEHRRGPPAGPEHRRNLLEQLVARIKPLPLLVAPILPVLPHQQHPVHGQLPPPQCKRVRNGRVNLHRGKPPRTLPAQIVLLNLIHVKRHHIHLRPVMPPVPPIALQKPIHNMLRVRILVKNRHNPCNPRSFCHSVPL